MSNVEQVDYKIKKATLEDLDSAAELFNLY